MVIIFIVSVLVLKQIKTKSFIISLNLDYDFVCKMPQKIGLAMVTHINKPDLDVLAYGIAHDLSTKTVQFCNV
jgi:hypothetical protein